MLIYGKRVLVLFLIITINQLCVQKLSAMWPFNRCTKKVAIHPDEPTGERRSGRPSRALSAPVGTFVDDRELAAFARSLSVKIDGSIEVRSMVKKIFFEFNKAKPFVCAGEVDPILMVKGESSDGVFDSMTINELVICIKRQVCKIQQEGIGAYFSDPYGCPALVFESDDLLFPIDEKQFNFSWVAERCNKNSGIDYIFIVKLHESDSNELKGALCANGIVRGCIYCLADDVDLSDVSAIALWRKEIEHILCCNFYLWHFWQAPDDESVKVAYQA